MEYNQSDSKTWFIATDGSEHSRIGFDECLKEFYDKNDRLIVCSITDTTKDYLPREYQPDTIYNDYHTFLLSHIHSSKYQILMEEKDLELSIKDQILQEAARKNAFAIFIGFSGRKGLKADPTLMGSTVRHAALRTSIPIIITKKLQTRAKTSTGGFTFLVCLDGSKKSLHGLNIVAKFATSPRDQILGCIINAIEVETQVDRVRNIFNDFIQENGIKGEFLVLDYSKVRGDAITEFVNRNERYSVHYVVFGNSGLKAEQEDSETTILGSVAEHLIANLHSNLILLP